MRKILLPLVFVALFSTNCSRFFHKSDVDLRFGIDNNACKKMQGKTLIYLIFVDTKTTKPWSNFDLKSAVDSVKKTSYWLQKQSGANNQDLKIQVDYFGSKSKTKTIARELPKASIYESLDGATVSAGINKLNKYADDVCKKVLTAAYPVESKNSKSSPRDKLISILREKYSVENVALMFMFNNYYMDDFSVTCNTLSKTEMEYAMTSYKSPTLIAQQVMSLFGAAGMGEYYVKSKNKNAKFALEEFPNDVMVNLGRDLNELEIGEYSQYMIGWTDIVDKKYERFFYVSAEKE